MSEHIWTTREGIKTKITELGDSHIINIAKMLRRSLGPQRMNLAMSMIGHSFDPESMAAYYTERDSDILMMMTDDEFIEEQVPQYGQLMAEIYKRGLDSRLEA